MLLSIGMGEGVVGVSSKLAPSHLLSPILRLVRGIEAAKAGKVFHLSRFESTSIGAYLSNCRPVAEDDGKRLIEKGFGEARVGGLLLNCREAAQRIVAYTLLEGGVAVLGQAVESVDHRLSKENMGEIASEIVGEPHRP